jgi:hypothetical protein
MRKLSRIIISTAAITGLLLSLGYPAERDYDDRIEQEPVRVSLSSKSSGSKSYVSALEILGEKDKVEERIEGKSSGGASLFKTLAMGALMLSSPAAVMAANPGFVGSYAGAINRCSQSNNISIYTLETTNWGSSYTDGAFATFYPNKNTTGTPQAYQTQFYFNIECEKESYCKYLYIKSAQLCNKAFNNINYYASIIFNPQNYVPSSAGDLSAWKYYSLAVWDSLSSNNTEFDQMFSSYMKTAISSNPGQGGTCP